LTPDILALKSPTQKTLSLGSLNIEDAEEKLIREALIKHSGNIKKASEALGINRTSLYRRMKKYGL
ncbi:MAG: sigma-54-dependent Fis family transcriptional regulator, partial [Candidatus Cloacimonetes bacterium]|nr:sigma-54-dependent Fis family transcriptional regulator [Candidatus Cloacimonadota bacterium]